MKKSLSVFSLFLLAAPSTFISAAETEFSALLEQELAIDNEGNMQKFETLFKPEWQTTITDNLEMTLIGRGRFDSQTNLGPEDKNPYSYSSINGPLVIGEHGELSIREWYVDTEIADTFWRIGKQQVVWGQADGLKVLDVVNPQSYREFILDDFADSRIPLWMVNVEIPVGDDDSLQLLWIPDLTYNELAETGATYQMTSPLFVPQLADGSSISTFNQSKPSSMLKDSDFGLRYAKFYNGWDLTFNYLYHYHDTAVLFQTVDQNRVTIDSKYKRNQLLGITASKAFGDVTLRSEVGYSSDTYHLLDNSSVLFFEQQGVHNSADISSVIGLDWQGLQDTLLSVQWFQSYLLDYKEALIRPRQNNIVSFLYNQSFENEIWELDVLILHGFDQNDGSVQTKLNYMLQSNIKLWGGSDLFYGQSAGLFGQFKETDRITFGLQWGF